MRELVVATRGSLLALAQTRWVVDRLQALHPGCRFRIQVFRTTGDATQATGIPLPQVGAKGLFTRELEEALLDGRADLAVHSLKDMPTDLPPGLAIGCIPPREDPRDVVIAPAGRRLADLPPGATVGTSSLRRVAQLRRLRPDLEYVPIRGNVDTRLRKLDEGRCAALVMAAAGLHRAGFAGRISEYLDPAACLPAPGQGALAIEVRAGDGEVAALLAPLHHPETALAVAAERAFMARITAAAGALARPATAEGGDGGSPGGVGSPLARSGAASGAPGQAPPLGGSCQVPVAAHATLMGDRLRLRGLVAALDGSEVVAWEQEGPAGQPEDLGAAVAAAVLDRGGLAIVARIHGGTG